MEDREILQKAAALLIEWYAASRRVLPWRQSPTPYHVWISEIMLQQTRIEAVIPYYERFLKELPDVASSGRGWATTAAPATCAGRQNRSWTNTAASCREGPRN